MTNHKLVAIAVGPNAYRLALAHLNPAVMDYKMVDHIVYRWVASFNRERGLAVADLFGPDEINGHSTPDQTYSLSDAYSLIRQFERGMICAVDSLGEEHANKQSEAMAAGLF